MIRAFPKVVFTTLIGLLGICFLTACDQAAKPQSKPGSADSKSLPEQLIGYWAPDAETMLETAVAKMTDGQNTEEDIASTKAQIDGMAGEMVIHFDGANSTIYGMGKPETASYEVVSVDEETKSVVTKLTGPDGEEEEGTAILDGDKMSLINGGITLPVVRISEKLFKQRFPE